MKLYFKLNDKEYSTIDSNELTIYQYFTILDIINNDDDVIKTSENLLREISNIPHKFIDSLDIFSFIVIDWTLYIKNLMKLNKIKKTYNGFNLKDLDKLKFGEYIDLDYFTIQDNDKKIIDIVSLMLLGNDYSKNDFVEMKKNIYDMTIVDVLTIYNYFISYRNNIFKNFNDLFNDVEDEEEDDDGYTLEELKIIEEEKQKPKHSSWLETAYMLSNKDITKVDDILEKPLFSILNYLVWLKAENEEEIRRLKNNNR